MANFQLELNRKQRELIDHKVPSISSSGGNRVEVSDSDELELDEISSSPEADQEPSAPLASDSQEATLAVVSKPQVDRSKKPAAAIASYHEHQACAIA